jgi:hypothetical protein
LLEARLPSKSPLANLLVIAALIRSPSTVALNFAVIGSGTLLRAQV